NPRSLLRPTLRPLDTVETLEQVGHVVGGDARAGVPHGQFDVTTGVPERDGDLAFECELECVGDEVEYYLLPHFVIDEYTLGQRGAIDNQPQPGPLTGRPEVAREVGGERVKVGRLVDGTHPPGLDARE